MNDIPLAIREKFLDPFSAVPVELAESGLSSSRVYRCRSPQGNLCLRCWPSQTKRDHLAFIQRYICHANDQGLPFLCRYLPSRDRQFFELCDARFWELTTWLPGKADYVDNPSQAKLQSATQALAKLHNVWRELAFSSSESGLPSGLRRSPAVEQRYELLSKALSDFSSRKSTVPLDVSGPTLGSTGSVSIARLSDGSILDETQWTRLIESQVAEWSPCISRTVECLHRLGPYILRELETLRMQPAPVHFVLRDVWSEHVLFSGENVTGIVDYGAARIDEPATDLARLLGSLEPHDQQAWSHGFQCYRQLSDTIDLRRVRILDRATCLLSAVQWMRWLGVEQKSFAASNDWLRDRWTGLLGRLESMQSN